jgi:hypothetical protein
MLGRIDQFFRAYLASAAWRVCWFQDLFRSRSNPPPSFLYAEHSRSLFIRISTRIPATSLHRGIQLSDCHNIQFPFNRHFQYISGMSGSAHDRFSSPHPLIQELVSIFCNSALLFELISILDDIRYRSVLVLLVKFFGNLSASEPRFLSLNHSVDMKRLFTFLMDLIVKPVQFFIFCV